jgi:uncharacterized damage-inducible protein DinB
MSHLLVKQLRFARSELVRALEGINDDEARIRLGSMNCMSWMVGHLADQENRYWVFLAQGVIMEPDLNALTGYHQPASTPPLEDMWAAWRNITRAADTYLETLSPALLASYIRYKGKPRAESVGTMLMRTTYHYWYHTGEAAAVRQQLGHKDLPEFVGEMSQAVYFPEEEADDHG